MNIQDEERRRSAFRELLFSLAESQDKLESKSDRYEVYKELEEIYYVQQDNVYFKHFYSDIFSVLTQIKQGDRIGSVEVLGQNIAEIRKGYRAQNYSQNGVLIDISDKIRKLYDHLSLDIARMGYSDANDWRLLQEETVSDIKSQLESQIDASKVIDKQLEQVNGKLERSQREYIAILGIFASIVLAFTGGIAFSSSVIENLHKASIYRIFAVSLIIGLVLVNVLFGLFYYLDRLTSLTGKKKIVPLVIANTVILGLLLFTILGWTFNVVEKRNGLYDGSKVVDITSESYNSESTFPFE